MFPNFSLNQRSLQMIETICNNAANSTVYKNYKVTGANDPINGTAFIDITKDGGFINKFLFSPTPNGDIASIAIYGINLKGHFETIRSSMNIFGLAVDDVEMDSGYSDFVDVTLKEY